MPKVFVLYLQFTNQYQSEGLEKINQVFKPIFPQSEFIYLVIDNSLKQSIEYDLNNNFIFLSGDNSSREFSGWDKGFQYLKEFFNFNSDDLFIFANDTFFRSYGDDYLKQFNTQTIPNLLNQSQVFGYMDGYPRSVKIAGQKFRTWIRSSIFVGSTKAIKKIMPLTWNMSKSDLFGDTPDQFFKPTAPLSDNLKTYLKTWLFEQAPDESEFKHEWHSKIPLTEESLRKLQEKAWCILCEFNLSNKARKNGLKLISSNGLR